MVKKKKCRVIWIQPNFGEPKFGNGGTDTVTTN